MANVELAVSYAALILADEGLEITAEKLQTTLAAAKIEIEPIWTVIFAKALEGKDVKDLMLNIGSGGGGPVAVGPSATGPSGTEEQTQEPDHDHEREGDNCDSDDDLGLSLFD
ncbi:hypothetical protein ABW19_dt0202096 [Dactylella cylindrospora]|nr:hypothetical protein ABW19_dt0202096 [Dactylella cylindrospora]